MNGGCGEPLNFGEFSRQAAEFRKVVEEFGEIFHGKLLDV